MGGKALGITGTKLATLTLAITLGSGLAGCRFDEEKSDKTASSGDTSTTSPTTTTPPPTSSTNRAPNISGTPTTTAKVGLPYSFQPVASDPDGDRLTFEIKSKPNWATFDAATGRIAGTPPDGSAGTFTGVQIVVSDGKTSTAMNPFSINVVMPATGSAELVWEAPTANVDGTPLTDLSGYVIRYGKTAGALDKSIRINNPGTTMHIVDNLIEGTWYFSLSSLNSAGVESRPTGYVSRTIG